MSHTGDLNDLNEAVKMTKKEEIDAFSSKIIHAWTKTTFLDSNIHVMMLALEEGNGSHLPHGLSIINTCTKMATRSNWVLVIMKNLTAALITIAKGVRIAWVIAANDIPQVEVSPGMLEKLDEMQGIQRAKIQLSRERKCSSSNWTCLAWRGGPLRIELLHALYWLNTTTFFPWNLRSWAALIWWKTKSKSLMMNPSKRGSGESLHLW